MNGVSGKDPLHSRGLSLDPERRLLLVKGRRVELDARSLAVLQALTARFGERVSKDALLAAGWPNQVVHENSLAKAISRLRRALAGSGVAIVASYGVGYVLRDEGAEEGAATDPAAAAQAEPVAVVPSRPRWGRRAAAASMLLLVGAAGAILATRSTLDEVAIRQSPPITHDAPDARAKILWVDDNPANNRLEVEYLRRERIAVHLATSTQDALNLLAMKDYRLVVSDMGRGDDRLAGLKMTKEMAERGMAVPVIIYTIRPDGRAQQAAQRAAVAKAGVADLALTPAEVRAKILARVDAAEPRR